MQPIPMLGLLPYIYLMYKYNSFRAYAIFCNGMLYHGNDKNIQLRYYDILCNCLIGYYSFKKKRQPSFRAGYFAVVSFLLNNLLFYKLKINEKHSYIIHVLFTQWPIGYLLFKELRCKLE